MLDVYRRTANLVGTNEAIHLAHLLSAWHDAMVRHRRRLLQLGFDPDGSGGDESPYTEAPELWLSAREIFGAHAEQLEFLRTTAGTRTGRGRS